MSQRGRFTRCEPHEGDGNAVSVGTQDRIDSIVKTWVRMREAYLEDIGLSGIWVFHDQGSNLMIRLSLELLFALKQCGERQRPLIMVGLNEIAQDQHWQVFCTTTTPSSQPYLKSLHLVAVLFRPRPTTAYRPRARIVNTDTLTDLIVTFG
jgi:hypothetical protein